MQSSALPPVQVGIVLTCGTEVELSLLGVLMGVLSTFMTNLQTIFGKTLLDDTLENRIGEMELQFWTCLMSAAIYFPLWCITEGPSPVTEAPGETYMLLLAAGVLYFSQSWVALKVLAKLDCALTHTIASTFKRVVLIVFSAMWFGKSGLAPERPRDPVRHGRAGVLQLHKAHGDWQGRLYWCRQGCVPVTAVCT